MIDVYSRRGCNACDRIKIRLNAMGLEYKEHIIGEDTTREYVLENFPGQNSLPILSVDGMVYSGTIEISEALDTYGTDIGKMLLSE
jgi:glutaredoxin